VLTIAGTYFPAWLVCALAGALLAALLRPLFLALRIEAYLWPRLSRWSGDIGRHSLVQPCVTPPLATALNPHIGSEAERREVMGPTVAEDLVDSHVHGERLQGNSPPARTPVRVFAAHPQVTFWSTVIGKKVVMAVTGAILVGFVIGYILDNLLIFTG